MNALLYTFVVDQHIKKSAKKHNLEPTTYKLLLLLDVAKKDSLTLKDFYQFTGLHQPHLYVYLHKLMSIDYIYETKQGLRKYYFLTENGKNAVKTFKLAHLRQKRTFPKELK